MYELPEYPLSHTASSKNGLKMAHKMTPKNIQQSKMNIELPPCTRMTPPRIACEREMSASVCTWMPSRRK